MVQALSYRTNTMTTPEPPRPFRLRFLPRIHATMRRLQVWPQAVPEKIEKIEPPRLVGYMGDGNGPGCDPDVP